MLHEARFRCRNCATQALCDWWLLRTASGNNDFCPIAWMLRMLASENAIIR